MPAITGMLAAAEIARSAQLDSDAASTDTGDASDATGADDTRSASQTGSTGDPDRDASDSGGTTNVSPLKSLTYGTLGLERPDQSKENTNPFYTAGRWIAAGLTIGGLISLLV